MAGGAQLYRISEIGNERADEIAYKAAAAAAATGQQWLQALGILEEKRAAGIAVDFACYNLTLRGCTRNWQGASWLLEVAYASRLSLPAKLFNSTFASLSDAGAAEGRHSAHSMRAMCFLSQMQKYSVQQTVCTLTAAAHSMNRLSEWRAALSLLLNLQGGGLQPDAAAYCTAITACRQGQQPLLALRLLQDMTQQFVKPNVLVCNAAISACSAGHEWKLALAVFEEMSTTAW